MKKTKILPIYLNMLNAINAGSSSFLVLEEGSIPLPLG